MKLDYRSLLIILIIIALSLGFSFFMISLIGLDDAMRNINFCDDKGYGGSAFYIYIGATTKEGCHYCFIDNYESKEVHADWYCNGELKETNISIGRYR